MGRRLNRVPMVWPWHPLHTFDRMMGELAAWRGPTGRLSMARLRVRPAKPKRAASQAMWRVMHWVGHMDVEWGVSYLIRRGRQWERWDSSFREQRQRKRVRWQARESARRVVSMVRGAPCSG